MNRNMQLFRGYLVLSDMYVYYVGHGGCVEKGSNERKLGKTYDLFPSTVQ